MAYTLSQNVTFGGSGGEESDRPEFWLEDILFLIQEEKPKGLIKRNIKVNFDEKELRGLMADDVKEGDKDRIIILTCPPYLEPSKKEP